MDGITSGQLAQQAQINQESIRFYERQGLLAKPPRSASGYGIFPPESVQRIRFIKRAQELGFSLKEIKELLALGLDPDTSCAVVQLRAQEKVEEIEKKVRDLQRMKRTLTHLAAACPGHGATSDCPILESLNSNSTERD